MLLTVDVHRRSRSLQAAPLLGILMMITACGSGSNSQQAQQTMIPPPSVSLTQLSTDSFTNPSSQHATEVEASASAFGSTIVSAFQVGRIFGGGASDIGFATSTNAGAAWTSGFLPGITIYKQGTFSAASDPVVAFDAAHGTWIISSLTIANVDQVAVSRSPDGINWGNPIIVSTTPDSDKNWIACDNTSTSPYFGHCYLEWDDPSTRNLIWMSTSTDGGLTWAAARSTADLAAGIGGQPVVQPNGTVIVPIENATGDAMLAFTSTNGGTSWSASATISSITDHLVAGNLRTSALPSAAIDAAGKVYAIWQDCRFRTGCSSNDLVMSTSTDGVTWTTPARIPIDALTSTVDHFIPGLAVEPATSGSTAHLGLTYYFYGSANCDASTCALYAGFISSPDGGATWAAPTTLAGPMSPAWLPNTFAGLMVGDYVSTTYSGGKAFAIFAAAQANSGTVFDEPMYTTTTGLAASQHAALFTSADEQPVSDAHSDHARHEFYDQEHRYPMSPQTTRKRLAHPARLRNSMLHLIFGGSLNGASRNSIVR
ncbi:MAG TPA: sialidase family protein [Terriglobales bacterium]|nr:sialidase family protein [Terriglobales bacterium]